MSCIPCHNKLKEAYKEIQRISGIKYVEYQTKLGHFIASEHDFKHLKTVGAIPEDTESRNI